MLTSENIKVCVLIRFDFVDKSHEEQIAEWMLDNDIDVTRVMDYIREVEETRYTTTG